MLARGLRAFAITIAIGFATAGTVVAQDPIAMPSPLLTLDQERLFNGSREAERIAAEFERRKLEWTAENRKIEAQLEAEELDLTDRRPGLPPDEFRALADAFDVKVQGIRAAQDAKGRDLQRWRDQQRQDFLGTISPLLAEIVRARGAVALLDRRAVLVSADAIDITDEAIARINAAIEAAGEQPIVPGPDVPPEPDAPVTPDQN